MSFRHRLVLLVAGGVVLVGSVVVVAIYAVVRGQLLDQTEQELRALATVVRPAVSDGRLPSPQRGPGARPPNVPRIVSADGEVIDTVAPRLEVPVTAQARSVAAGTLDSSFEIVDLGPERSAVITVPSGQDRALQIIQSFAPVEETLGRLLRTSILVGGGIVLLAPLVGYLVAGGALVPVRRLSRTAEDIARTADLGQRATVRGGDELASLAASFNAMLDRLEEMVGTLENAQQAQRQLVADASHELRTPLTTLRANVELLALGPHLAEAERDDLAVDTISQIDDLTGLMGHLIDLAREDEREPEREPVRFDEVVEDELDRTRPRYPDVSFAAELEATTVLGARDALARAVANLLDNAGKWSPQGATVEVSLRHGTLEVRDHGPGIDDADLPHVFQRFYRGAHRGVPGSGLGLAIVGQVVSSHGGDVWAEQPDGGGTSFRVRLPTDGT